MKKELLTLATHLDSIGEIKLADRIDAVVKQAQESDFGSMIERMSIDVQEGMREMKEFKAFLASLSPEDKATFWGRHPDAAKVVEWNPECSADCISLRDLREEERKFSDDQYYVPDESMPFESLAEVKAEMAKLRSARDAAMADARGMESHRKHNELMSESRPVASPSQESNIDDYVSASEERINKLAKLMETQFNSGIPFSFGS